MAATLRFELLGELRVLSDGQELPLGGPKQKSVLAALLLERGRVVSRDRLVEAVWGEESADSAARTLQVYVSNLRKAMRADLITTRGSGYAIALGPDTCDLDDLRHATDRAEGAFESGRYEEAAAEASVALALFKGTPLSEFDAGYFAPDAAHLAEARLALELIRHEALLMGDRDPATVIADLERAAGAHPLDERLHALLMTAQYRAGRQGDALATCAVLRERLIEQLGLDPSTAITTLEQRIIEQDPSLLAPERALEATRTVRVAVEGAVPAMVALDGHHILLDAAITTIGRLPDRTIVLAHDDVSRRHAEIRRSPTGYVLVDCDSTNGVRVNGELVPRSALADGDVIEIGSASMTFIAGG